MNRDEATRLLKALYRLALALESHSSTPPGKLESEWDTGLQVAAEILVQVCMDILSGLYAENFSNADELG